MLNPPFNLLCSGITNCGKTQFILDFIQANYKFDFIVLFCPTFLYNKTYRNHPLVKRKNFIINKKLLLKNDTLDSMLAVCYKQYKNSNTLFLLDDIANLWDAKHRCSELCKLAFSARHARISVWVLTQKYNGIVKDFRDNIRMLVLFYNKDKSAMEDALKENNIIPKDEIEGILKTLKDNKHSKLIMQLEQPLYYEVLYDHMP